MKKVALFAILILTVSLASRGNNLVTKGQSNSAFGNYKIEKLDDHMILKAKQLDQYLISYENSDVKVIVAIDKQKKCKKYYILSDQIPVQYECNGTYFGLKKIDKELINSGYQTSMEQLNREEFFHQRVLTSEMVGTIDHLILIASYYPGLFKDQIAKVS